MFLLGFTKIIALIVIIHLFSSLWALLNIGIWFFKYLLGFLFKKALSIILFLQQNFWRLVNEFIIRICLDFMLFKFNFFRIFILILSNNDTIDFLKRFVFINFICNKSVFFWQNWKVLTYFIKFLIRSLNFLNRTKFKKSWSFFANF